VKDVLLCRSNGPVFPEFYFGLVYILFRQDILDAVVRTDGYFRCNVYQYPKRHKGSAITA